MKPSAFEYIAPETTEEALEALAEHGDEATILAGGQSLIPMMNLRIAAPPRLIDIMRIRELAFIRREDGWIEIGAGMRMAQAERAIRARESEALLTGAAPTPDAIAAAAERAAEAIDPPVDVHAGPHYRRRLVRALVRRALEELAAP